MIGGVNLLVTSLLAAAAAAETFGLTLNAQSIMSFFSGGGATAGAGKLGMSGAGQTAFKAQRGAGRSMMAAGKARVASATPGVGGLGGFIVGLLTDVAVTSTT